MSRAERQAAYRRTAAADNFGGAVDMGVRVAQYRAQLVNATTAYRRARRTDLICKIMVGVGFVMSGLGIVGGFGQEASEILGTPGVIAFLGGAAGEVYFFKPDEDKKTRMQRLREAMQDAEDLYNAYLPYEP